MLSSALRGPDDAGPHGGRRRRQRSRGGPRGCRWSRSSPPPTSATRATSIARPARRRRSRPSSANLPTRAIGCWPRARAARHLRSSGAGWRAEPRPRPAVVHAGFLHLHSKQNRGAGSRFLFSSSRLENRSRHHPVVGAGRNRTTPRLGTRGRARLASFRSAPRPWTGTARRPSRRPGPARRRRARRGTSITP
mgnify:CR=1 FL=1